MYRNNYMQKRSCCGTNNDDKQEILKGTCENNNYLGNSCNGNFNEEKNIFPENPMYAQSYVPWQTIDKTFVPDVGLRMGTLFPELVSPYKPGQSLEEIEYLKMKKGCGNNG